MKPETRAIHVPKRRGGSGAIAPPINLSTTFEHGPANELVHGFQYVRHSNPNVDDLESRLAAIEGGANAVVFGSGMAAAAAMLATVAPGARVLFHRDLYFDVKTLARTVLEERDVAFEFIDFKDTSAYEAAMATGATLVWLETPSNPTMDVLDIDAICTAAKAAGAAVLVDSTFAPPVIQQPLKQGADYVLHSLTKYMGGHSDVQGGAIIVRDDAARVAALRRTRQLTGGVLPPFSAWMVSRGLQTLYCRVERHCANALAVATALDGHPAVERVRYPYLPSNPQYALARRQMSAGGGMVSIDVAGGADRAIEVASRVQLFVNATSLGGVESLIEHRVSVEGPASTTPPALLRLSIGLEHPDDLIADLLQALD